MAWSDGGHISSSWLPYMYCFKAGSARPTMELPERW